MEERLNDILSEILEHNSQIELRQREINRLIAQAKYIHGVRFIDRDSIMSSILSYESF